MKKFAQLGVSQNILNALRAQKIEVPTEIQIQTIPILLKTEGDFVGKSATGTGKTFAFGIPLLQRINPEKGYVQALVLTPTRDLCQQVAEELSTLGKEIEGLHVEGAFGGSAIKPQIKAVSHGVQIIVATPGRLVDLIERKVVDLARLEFLVVDEADEMLTKGFQKDIENILSTSSKTYSTWLFSATMPQEISQLIKKYLTKELKKVYLGEENQTNTLIKHQFIVVDQEEKLQVFLWFLAGMGEKRGIIFCRTKSGVQKLYKQLQENTYTCGTLHGELSQAQRNKVLDQFNAGHISYIVCTDVAARGLDIPDLDFVVHYHLPDSTEFFIHRSGRTARAGKEGHNFCFVMSDEKEAFTKLQKDVKVSFAELTKPGPKELIENQLVLQARRVARAKIQGDLIGAKTRENVRLALKNLSKDELIEKLMGDWVRGK